MVESYPVLFFSDETIAKDKCSKLSEDHEQSIAWESVRVSGYSPCVVQDLEILARQIFSPIHLDRNSGKINTAAFTDTFNKGLSVNRLSYISEEDTHSLGERKANRDRVGSLHRTPKERDYIGFLAVEVGCIRGIVEGESRAFGVFDTALKEAPSHADICCILPENSPGLGLTPKAAKKARRESLMRAFGEILSKP